MRIASGIVFLLVGLLSIMQVVSAVNYRFAQRIGFQPGDDGSDPLYLALELNTARWDSAVLWTLALAGLLMLLDHSWWPYVALIAGGVYVDTGGRELAKIFGLRRRGVTVGDWRTALVVLTVLAAIGLWAALYGLIEVV